MEDWYSRAINMKDEELVEIPVEFVEKACDRFGITPPPPGKKIQLPAGVLKRAYEEFTGGSPQSGE